ncbi:MAG: hypothetical protein QXU01_04485 [Candidatus Hadarchaeales archaeon]
MKLKKKSLKNPIPLEDIFVEPKNQKLVVYLPPTVKNILEELARESNVKTTTCVLYIIIKQLKELGFLK